MYACVPNWSVLYVVQLIVGFARPASTSGGVFHSCEKPYEIPRGSAIQWLIRAREIRFALPLLFNERRTGRIRPICRSYGEEPTVKKTESAKQDAVNRQTIAAIKRKTLFTANGCKLMKTMVITVNVSNECANLGIPVRLRPYRHDSCRHGVAAAFSAIFSNKPVMAPFE